MDVLHELPPLPEPTPPRRRRGLPLWARILVGFVAAFFGLLAAAIVTVRIPAVQTRLAVYLTELAKEKTGFDVRFGRIDLNFYDVIYLHDIVAYDLEGRKMIEIPEASIDFALTRLLRRDVAFDNILAKNGHVRIVNSRKLGEVNITQFVERLEAWLSPDTTRSKNPANFFIYSAGISDFQLTIDNENKPLITDGFDYNHIHLDSITGIVENFRTRADTLEFNLPSLRARDSKTAWKVHKLTTFYRLTRHDMTLAPMKLWVGHSYLADTLQFQYGKKGDMADFVEKVTVRANLVKSRIDYRDLALFATTLKKVPDSVRVASARVRGRVPDFTVDQMVAVFGKESELVGKVRMIGLPDFWTTTMAISLRPSYIDPEDLRKYVPASAFTYLDRLGPTDLEGTYTGTWNEFRAKGGVYGRNGTLLADMEMRLHGGERSTYSGTFTADNLALGTLTARPDILNRVTGQGKIKGRGFSLETAKVEVKGDFDKLDLYGYPYRRVKTDATLAQAQFDGYLSVRDSNLMADANGIVDLSHPRKFFDVELNLKRARLKPLGWAGREAFISGRAYVNGAGADADDAEGILTLDSSRVEVNGQRLDINALELETRRDADQRSIRLKSDYVSGTMEGNFTFRTIAADLEAALNDYGRLFRNEKALANRTAVYTNKEYGATLRLNLQDITPLLRLYAPGLQVAPKTTLSADLTKTGNLLLQADLATDYVAYGESVFDAVKVDIATSKKLNEDNVLASASISSPSQRFGNLVTKELNLEGVWSGGEIDFSTAIRQYNDSNYVDLHGELGFEPGYVRARLNAADIRLLDSTWQVSPKNSLVFDGVRVGIDSLSFATTGQRVEVFGMAGPGASDTLHLGVDSLSASFAKAFLDGRYMGKASAQVDLVSLMSKESRLGGVLSVLGFSRDGVPLGDIHARLVPQPADASLLLDIKVDKDSVNLLRGGGILRPTSLDRQLDLDFRLNKAPIAYLEPLFKGLASQWEGTATGHLSVDGSLDQPELTGAAFIDDGGITLDYLKTRYFFADSVYLRHGLISATGARLRDAQGHTATLTKAEVRHRYFENFIVDLHGDVDGLQLLGTTYKDNKLYYGAAYGSGQLSITGPVGDIVIAATLRTEKGTKMFLPLQSALASNTTQQSFITFCARCDTLTRNSRANTEADSLAEARRQVNLSGIRLAFNIEVTPDAYGEIIFDRQTGDAVGANGSGRIKLNIDTRGDFTMVGRYNITNGNYKFTFANLIDKTFNILDGSSITWSGPPSGGVLDIQARYPTTVPLTPLLIGYINGRPDSAQLVSEAQRRYPVNVNMNLAGPMLTPSITLGLDIPNQYPNTLSPFVTSLQGLVTNNEQELNKQVFSLLLLRSFSPTGLNTYASAASSVGNLSELLSNQLSAWLSEVNQNLEVGVNLAGFNQQSLDNFQLRLSYTALDGRLRVTRNGAFTNTASQATAASLAGDWTLEYNLTRDGKLRAKVFHRTNQTLANAGIGLGNQYSTTSQGASILHTQSFSSLRELAPWLYKKSSRLRPVVPPGPETSPSPGAPPVQTPGAPAQPQPLPPNKQPDAQPTAVRVPKS